MSTIALPATAEHFFERFDPLFSFLYREGFQMFNDQASHLRCDLGARPSLVTHRCLAC